MLAGAERSLLELVRELSAYYNVHSIVVLPSRGPIEKMLIEAGAKVIIAHLNWWCAHEGKIDIPIIKKLYAESFNWIVQNLDCLDRLKPDIIMTNTLVMPWGAVCAFLLKCPHIWMVREFGKIGDQGFNFFLPFSDVLNFIQKSSDKIITCSHAVQKELFPNIDDDKIETIYNYIEVPPKEKIAKYSSNHFFHIPEACHLLIFGSIIKLKGQEDAVRAAIELVKKRHRKVELVIAGYSQPDYKDYLREIIESQKGNDYIRIYPFQKNIFPLLHDADVVLVCSKMEAFARVNQEAMLMGKPVIATNIDGNTEMIKHMETGLLYYPGDFMELADCIEMFMDNPFFVQEVIDKAYKYAIKTFSVEEYGGRFKNIIDEITNKKYEDKLGISQFVDFQRDILSCHRISPTRKIKNYIKKYFYIN